MNPYSIIAVAVGACAVVVGAYTLGYRAGDNAAEASRQREEELVAQVRDAALQASAEAISKIEVKNVTLKQQIQGKVLERTVYRECKHDADGLRIINSALTGESVSDSKLPAARPAQ